MDGNIKMIIGIAVVALPSIIAYLLPRAKTEKYGVKIGRMISVFLRSKLGGAVEDRLELTLLDFANGLKRGMRQDNK